MENQQLCVLYTINNSCSALINETPDIEYAFNIRVFSIYEELNYCNCKAYHHKIIIIDLLEHHIIVMVVEGGGNVITLLTINVN